ncbi:MAG: low molecular weight protein tyrosine phosphatase family protein [Luteolibacter sp.]
MPKRLLFICSRNRLRSPTAEAIFADRPGIEIDSAGLAPDAQVVLDTCQIQWADVILMMEPIHRQRLQSKYGEHLRGKRVVVLGILDNYDFMDPELIRLLEMKCGPYLR